ncbi:MAG: 2-haloacid dehalogenase [Acidimicrobiales bacterium]|jgi:2-haloacid dehalogenase
MSYTTVLLDLDHTLFDTDASEEAAFGQALVASGIDDPWPHFETYRRINRALWKQVEQATLTPDQVKTERFRQLGAELQLDADPMAMAERFTVGLGANGDLYPGARKALDDLAAGTSLALITNGLSAVQRARIERLDLGHYFDAVIISAEVGVAKPGSAIFDLTFDALRTLAGAPPLKDGSVMVGDSLTSDIKGGRDYGLATCWYNPMGAVSGANQITHEINDLADLATTLLG